MASENKDPSVVGETVKGAAKGFGAVVLGGLAVVAGAAALVAAAVLLPAGITAAVVGGTALAVGAAYIGSTVLATGAALGGGYGLYKGLSKSKEQAQAKQQEEQRRNQAIANTISATAQQAYMAGARDGQVHVINELHRAQAEQFAAAQEAQTNFAARVAQTKNAITPEGIIKQREAAAAASNQVN